MTLIFRKDFLISGHINQISSDKEMFYSVYTIEYYSVFKKNILPFVIIQVNLDYIMLSKISQAQKGLTEFHSAHLQPVTHPNSGSVMANTIARNHMLQTFKFKQNKIFSSLVALATLQWLNSHTVLVATIVDSTDIYISIIAESSTAQHCSWVPHAYFWSSVFSTVFSSLISCSTIPAVSTAPNYNLFFLPSETSALFELYPVSSFEKHIKLGDFGANLMPFKNHSPALLSKACIQLLFIFCQFIVGEGEQIQQTSIMAITHKSFMMLVIVHFNCQVVFQVLSIYLMNGCTFHPVSLNGYILCNYSTMPKIGNLPGYNVYVCGCMSFYHV